MKTKEACEKAGKEFLPFFKLYSGGQIKLLRFRKPHCRSIAFSAYLYFLLFTTSAVSGVAETPYFQEIHTISSSRMKISGPVGLAFIREKDALFVVSHSPHNWEGSSASLVTLVGRPLDKVRLPLLVQNPLNVAFSGAENGLYILMPSGRTLLKIPASDDGQLELDTSSWEFSSLSSIPLRDPAGMTFDPETGTLYILDRGQQSIIAITPQSKGNLNVSTALADGRVHTISVKGSGLIAPRSIAFDPQNRSLYILSPAEKKIYQLSDSGQFMNTIDISGFNLLDPQGMTFAPSADSTDDPAIMHLYIADDGLAAGQTSAGTGGQVMEFSLTAPAISAAALAAPTVSAPLVRMIDTYSWFPPSPDPAGIDYIPGLANYLVADSEVDEMTIFTGVNLYEMTPAGSLADTFSTTNLSRTGFSNEPTGVAHNDVNGHWFISDDSQLEVFEIDLGPDQTFGTADDTRTSFKTSDFGSDDPEGVAFDSQHQMLFIADGVNTEVYKIAPGINGIFDGVPPAGDDVMTHFDTGSFGMTDLEGIEYNPSTQTIYLTGGYSSSVVYECTTDGVLVRNIDISAAEPILKAPAGLAYGPGSGGPNTRSLYLVARGVDNDSHPDENDGEGFEFSLPGPVITSFSPMSGPESTAVTISGTGFSGTTSVEFNGASAGFTVTSDSQIDTTVPSGASTGAISVVTPAGTAVSASNFTVTTGGPAVSLSPTTLDFGDQEVNTTSSVQTVTLSNTGSSTLNNISISITGTNAGDFATANTANPCGSTLAAGSNCTIGVTFTPTTAGARTGAVSITDDAGTGSQTVSLAGNGVAAAPAVSLSPTSLTFPDQEVNTTSTPQTVTLMNTGTTTLTVDSVGASGDFAATGCVGSVAAGENCTINVTFTPTTEGTRTGTLSITDNASPSTQTISLSGTGVFAPPVVNSVVPSTLLMGTTATLAITGSNFAPGASLSFTNGQSSAPSVNSVTVVSTTSIQAGVTAPSNGPKRDRTWDVVVTNPDGNSGTLPGGLTIVASGPVVSLSTTSLNFGARELDTTSNPQTVTLSNTGNATLTVGLVSITGANPGDFSQSNTCGSSVSAGNSCQISVTFRPTATGTRTGLLTITDDASDSPQTVSLSGTGESSTTPTVRLSPSSLTFSSQTIGSTSPAQTITLTNTGTADLTVSSIAATGDFAQSNTCPGTVAAGSSCTISVTFTPTTAGTRTGAVTITDNAGTSPQTVSLTGTGVSSTAVVVESVSPNSLPTGTTDTLTITGLNFAQGASLNFTNGQGSAPSVNSLSVSQDGTTILAGVTTPSNGPKRNRIFDVVVVNPDGSSGNLSGGFTVTYP